MDLSKYIQKGKSFNYKKSLPEKKCHECGKALDDDGSYLYRLKFCSERCKHNYMTPKEQNEDF